MTSQKSVAPPHVKSLYKSYAIGFVLSVFLTMVAFVLTTIQVDSEGGAFPKDLFILGLLSLAVVQLVVQLLYFFHLGKESKPRLNTVTFLFMLMVVGIIGIGSLWIMYNLNYNMMPHEVEEYIQIEENIKKDGDAHHSH